MGSIPLHRAACDGRVAAKRRRLSNPDLVRAAACKAASCAVRMVPFLFAPDVVAAYPGLGYGLVMTEFFHVASGLEHHMREWLLRATHADRDEVDEHIARYVACDRSALAAGVTLSTVGLGQGLQIIYTIFQPRVSGPASETFYNGFHNNVVNVSTPP